MTDTAGWRPPARISALRPEAAALLEQVSALTHQIIEPHLLEIVRHASGRLIGNDEAARDAVPLISSDEDRDCLAFTEQFVIDVSGINDELRATLARHVPAGRQRAFVTAIYITEFTQRMDLMSERLLGRDPARVTHPTDPPAVITPEKDTDADAALIHVLRDYQDAVMRGTDLDPVVTELVRLRCARTHDCRICKTLRLDDARSAGVDESMTDKVDFYEGSDLDERIKLALRVTDGFISRPDTFSAQHAAEARAAYTPAQLAELMLDITKWSTQKIHVALGTDGAEHLPVNERGVSYFAFAEDGRVAGYSAVPGM